MLVEDSRIDNYIKICSTTEDNLIVNNAVPLDEKLSKDIKNLAGNNANEIAALSQIFIFSSNNTEFSKAVQKSNNQKVVVPKLSQIPQIKNQTILNKRSNKQILEYIDALGLFMRGRK